MFYFPSIKDMEMYGIYVSVLNQWNGLQITLTAGGIGGVVASTERRRKGMHVCYTLLNPK